MMCIVLTFHLLNINLTTPEAEKMFESECVKIIQKSSTCAIFQALLNDVMCTYMNDPGGVF